MKTFRVLLKTEAKLASRAPDLTIFGILFPIVMVLIIGGIYGNRPAYDGASYTFMQQNIGAIVAIGISATGLMGLPLTLSGYRHEKILKKFRVTPISPVLLLFIQVIIQLTVALISLCLVFLTATLIFGYKMEGSIIGFALSYLLVVFTVYGIGMIITSLAPNSNTAGLFCSLLYFPMLLLSGATIPFEVFPVSVQKVASILPLSHGIKLLKGTSIGLPIENQFFSIIVLSVIGIISIFISFKYFKWE